MHVLRSTAIVFAASFALLFAAVVHVPVAKGQTDRLRMAQTYENGGDLRNAARIYLELYDADPTREAAFQGIVRTLTGLKQPESLLPIVAKEAERDPSSRKLLLAAQLSAQLGKRQEAMTWWKRAVDSEADSESINALVARSQMDARMFGESAASYAKARERSDDPLSYARELSVCWGALGDIEKATIEALNEHRSTPDVSMTEARLAALMTLDSTQQQVGKVLLNADGLPQRDRLVAWYYRSIGDWASAYRITRKVDEDERQRGNEILRFADAARREGAYDIALEAYDDLVKTGQKQIALVASFGLVRTLDQRVSSQARIDTAEAASIIKRYRDVITSNPDHPLTADAMYRAAVLCDDILHDHDQARQLLTGLTNRWNGTSAAARGALLLADLYVAAGRTDAADDILQTLITNERQPEQDVRDLALLRRADLRLFSGDQKSAQTAYLEIIKHPESIAANDALDRLALLTLAIDDSVAVSKYFEGTNAQIRRDRRAAVTAFHAAAQAATDPEVKDRCLLQAAQSLFELGETEQAQRTLETVVERVPDALFGDRALLLLADCYERLGRKTDAIETLTTLLVQYPRSILAPTSRDRIRRLRGDA